MVRFRVRWLPVAAGLSAPSGCARGADPTDGGAPPGDGWDVVAEELGGALLSVTGRATNDVWAVGAPDGDGATVLHFDGAAWTRVPTPLPTGLWWAWAPPGETTLWAAGEAGVVARYDAGAPADGWTVETLDPALTLFGVWGASEDEIFAVGGDLDTASGAAIWRRDAGEWSEEELPDGVADLLAVYKVWGAGPDDVWAVGVDGLVLHRGADGAWTREDAGTGSLLLTVTGEGGRVWAVGGTGGATVVCREGGAWRDESPGFAPEWNGVSARDGVAVAVGRTGAVWRREDAGWAEHPAGRATYEDLHAAWIDPAGGLWAAGGQIAARPLVRGTLVHLGPTDPGRVED